MNEPLTNLPKSRRMQAQDYPIPVVAAIIRREQADGPVYLLIQRIHPPYQGKWALVGGKWDIGEGLSQAVRREVHEETGLTTEFIALREFVNERVIPSQTKDLGAQFAIFVCEVRANDGEPSEQDEGIVAWHTESQLTGLWERRAIVPTDYRILQKYIEAKQTLPYIEAEIIADDLGNSGSEVKRFEKIA